MTLHLLTGEYGPDAGGVGAYSHALVQALVRRGLRVRVWNTLDSTLQQSLPAALATHPGVVLLQYVPNALGAKGGNVSFCQWLLSLRRKGTDIRVMFHEPYFYLSWNPALNALAMVQRMMAAILLRASSRTYISTEQWRRYLASYAPIGTTFTVLPIPSTLPADPPTESIATWRTLLSGGHGMIAGHFGTYGDHVAIDLAPIVPACSIASKMCGSSASGAAASGLSNGWYPGIHPLRVACTQPVRSILRLPLPHWRRAIWRFSHFPMV